MKKCLLLLLVCAVCFSAAPALLASPITVGTAGTLPGDWSQQWQETGVTFNSIEAFLETSGVNFATSGMSAFNDPSWSSANINPQYAKATGDSSTNLLFNTNFLPASSTPFTMDLYSFNNGILNSDATAANWDGRAWSYSAAVGLANENTSPVPEPASLALLGTGLLLLGFVFRKHAFGADGGIANNITA